MHAAALDRLLWRNGQPLPAHPETRVVCTGESDVRIRDTDGDGPVVVFFCDPPVTVEAYDTLIDQFRDDYRVVVVELPGFGFSRPHHHSGYEFQAAVHSVEEVLSGLQTDEMVLCAPCICGFVATELVRRRRLSVRGLILMQTPDFAGMLDWSRRMDPRHVLRTPFVGQIVVRATARTMTRFWLDYASAPEYDPDGLVNTALTAQRQGAAFSLATMLQRWRNGPSDGNLQLPSLAIWGQQDRSHRDTDPQCTRKHVPAADIVSLPSCGHFPELEAPQAFCDNARPLIRRCLH